MIIPAQALRGVSFCVSGSREFFKRHNLDWDKFVREGLPEEELLATGDAMCECMVMQWKARNG